MTTHEDFRVGSRVVALRLVDGEAECYEYQVATPSTNDIVLFEREGNVHLLVEFAPRADDAPPLPSITAADLQERKDAGYTVHQDKGRAIVGFLEGSRFAFREYQISRA